jgi:hypothetical protein
VVKLLLMSRKHQGFVEFATLEVCTPHFFFLSLKPGEE